MFSPSTPARVASYLGISVVLAIYLAEWYAYHAIAGPSFVSGCVFNFLLVLAIWSHLKTSFTDPGTPESPEWQAWATMRRGSHSEDQWRSECEKIYANDENFKSRLKPLPGKPSWCKQCRHERPERAHHCSSCGVCILRMDHHCPWIASCIGWRNHKYFLLLTWWTFLACLAFLLTLFNSASLQKVSVSITSVSVGAIVAVMGVVIFGLLSGFIFCISLHAGMRNYTSIENHFHEENPYCLASSFQNLEQIMGPLDLRWLIPVCTTRPSNGTSFDLVLVNRAKDGDYGSV